MLAEPECSKRNCVHFLGILQSDETEDNEVPYCKAFPKGIPDDISYGSNRHDEVISGPTGQ